MLAERARGRQRTLAPRPLRGPSPYNRPMPQASPLPTPPPPPAGEPREAARANGRRERLFWKMHGLGNDFVILETAGPLAAETVRRLADRRRGVGADQILTVVRQGTREGLPLFAYRVYNADGGPAEQCGNGLRCLARWAVEEGHAAAGELWFTGPGGDVHARARDFSSVEIVLPPPVLDPAAVPFRAARPERSYTIEVNGMRLTIGAVATGNPHAVLRVEDVRDWPVAKLGPEIERHPLFPEGANVEFMQILSPRHVRLRVHERGTGETQACGSGSCAAVVWGRIMRWLEAGDVRVDLPGGTLYVGWDGEGTPLRLRGPAEHVFTGELA